MIDFAIDPYHAWISVGILAFAALLGVGWGFAIVGMIKNIATPKKK